MTYAKCPVCKSPLYAQQYDWAKVIGSLKLITAWDMTYHCAKGCGWGVAIPCDEDGEVTWSNE